MASKLENNSCEESKIQIDLMKVNIAEKKKKTDIAEKKKRKSA
jgi:hypothetical protein